MRFRRELFVIGMLALTSVVTVGLGPAPTAEAAGEIVLGPSTVEAHYQANGFGGGDNYGTVPMPQCNSENIEGRKRSGFAKWTITSSLGSGSMVYPGTEWDVTAVMFGHYVQANQWAYNDGPHPLKLRLQPYGPVEFVGREAKLPYTGPGTKAYMGEGSVGPLSNDLTWGYGFDSNSSPKLNGIVIETSDGVDLMFKVRMRATQAGVVTMPDFLVSGYDDSPADGDISCGLPLDWKWTVVNPTGPQVANETAATDATYFPATGEAQQGHHGININVLAGDDDPNIHPGVVESGDTSQVRIQSWSVTSAKGGDVECAGGVNQTDDWAAMSVGPCAYYPPQGYSGLDSFTYTVQQKTFGLRAQGKVSIMVAGNARPVAIDPDRYMPTGQNTVFDLKEVTSDPDGDPRTCTKLTNPPNIGAVTFGANCTATFFPDGTTGPGTFKYRVCDSHALVQNHLAGVRITSYHTGDASSTHARRCSDQEYTIIATGSATLAPIAVADHDVVDAFYGGPGPFSVSIPVLANDYDLGDDDPPRVALYAGSESHPDPSVGTVELDGTKVVFTPASGFSGPVAFKYLSCEFEPPEPPITALCAPGLVQINVLPNGAPIAEDDAIDMFATDVLANWNVGANDLEPDGEPVTCAMNAGFVSDPDLIETASITPDCVMSANPVDDATGELIIPYSMCDDHVLAIPAYPSVPYGQEGQAPGAHVSRCDTAFATITFVTTEQQAPEVSESPAAQRVFVRVVPARYWDTRDLPTFDGQHSNTGRLAAGASYKVQITGRGDVPIGAQGVVANLAAVSPDGLGYATLYPCTDTVPTASHVNYATGDVVANNAVVPLNAAGEVCVFTLNGSDFVLDVNGYVHPEAPDVGIDPTRYLDTRPGDDTPTFDDGSHGPARATAGSVVEVQIAGRGDVPVGARAAIVNVTAIYPAAEGYLTLYPCGGDVPGTSTVNYFAGQVVPNGALVDLSDDGKLCIFTLADTDIALDVAGFIPAVGAELVSLVNPLRLHDSRPGEPVAEGAANQQRLGAGETIEIQVTGRAGIPASAGAAFLNVAAVGPDGPGYVTLYPCSEDRPEASNVNFATGGTVRANNAYTVLTEDGTVCAYTLVGTHLVVDITGWTE